MSGMLNWLIEGATLAGMADKFCLVTKADLDLRHSKKSLHHLCTTEWFVLSWAGAVQVVLLIPGLPKHQILHLVVWSFGSSMNVILTEHLWLKLFSTGFPHCFANVFLFIHLIYKHHPLKKSVSILFSSHIMLKCSETMAVS